MYFVFTLFQVHVLAMDFCKFFLIDRFRIYCTFGAHSTQEIESELILVTKGVLL